MESLFTQTRRLAAPWRVAHVGLQQAATHIVFAVENAAKRLACPACGAADQPIHGRLARRWKHLNFFPYKAIIHA
ncbi:MAG: transposase family protein [Rhodanobacter sp.]|nr:MAG: transposase family protein [Rhodanobacter sp.]TAM13837.1 MAG: transposase family protein [Rhodanobacter sp.]TAM37696.1 MAG: transposase family protein [Rhodanobacter sp.]